MEVFTPTCLLCNTHFDRKPPINDKDDLQEGIAKKFKTGFNLFCKLLKGLGRERDPLDGASPVEIGLMDIEGDDRFRWGHPCCGECYMALVGLNKLEEIIKETRAQQKIILENLKCSISDTRDRTCYLDTEWEEVRILLLDYIKDPEVNATQSGNINEEVILNTSSKAAYYHLEDSDNDNDLDPPYSPCVIIPSPILGSEPDPLESDFLAPSFITEEDSYQEGPLVKRRRKSKSTTNEASTSKWALKPNFPNCQHPAAANLQPCFVSLTKLDIKDFPNSRIPEPPQTVESKMQESMLKFFSAIKPSNQELNTISTLEKTNEAKGLGFVHSQQCFYCIDDETLLFSYTAIKFLPTGLTCLERNCTYFVKGSDYFAFEHMKEHVIQCHEEDYASTRLCPLCREAFAYGKQIRRHILIHHSANGENCPSNLSRVICEICLKTMLQHNYAVHMWLHKNEEEKAAMLTSGEKIHSRLINSAEFRNWVRKQAALVAAAARSATKKSTKRKKKKKVGFKSRTKKPSIIPVGDTTVEEVKVKTDELLKIEDCVGEGRRLRNSASRTKTKKMKIYSEEISDLSASEANNNSDSDSDYQPTLHQELAPVKEKRSNELDSGDADSDCGSMTGATGSRSTVEDIENRILDVLKSAEKEKVVPVKEFKTHRKEKVFVQINSEILLFYCTPIKYSPSGFTCLEQDCSHFEKGWDFFGFENMKKHVIECHEKDYECGENIQICPICEKSCYAGVSILNHILSDHTTSRSGYFCGFTVICESCYKPMPYGSYECHVWGHKSAQEKQDMLENVGQLHSKLRCKLGLNKGKFRIRAERHSGKDRAKKTKPKKRKMSSSESNINSEDSHSDYQPIPQQETIQEDRPNKIDSVNCDSDCGVMTGNGNIGTESTVENAENERADILVSRKRRRRRRVVSKEIKTHRKEKVFVQINSEILLFYCTPINYSPSGFICLEQDCSHFEKGWDFFGFENMKKHVIECHEKDYEFGEKIQSCPICEKSCFAGVSILSHILSDHTTFRPNYFFGFTVICESCYRPMPYGSYICHVWGHKSTQEKQDMLENVEQINPKLRCRLGLNKGKFRIRAERRKRTDKSRIKDGGSKTKSNNSSNEDSDVSAEQSKSKTDRIQERTSHTRTKSTGINCGNKVKGDSDNSEVSQAIESHRAEFKSDNLFYLLGDNGLLFKDILFKFTPTEFICQEKGCGTEIQGSDYDTFKLLRKHVICKKRERDFAEKAKRTCPICNMEFIGVHPFRNHIFTVHSPPAVCTICWKPIQCYSDMKGHAELHMSDMDKKEQAMENHMAAALREKRSSSSGKDNESFVCSLCPKIFKKLHHLKMHKKNHLPKHLRQLFTCPDCGVQLLSKPALKSHIERVHRPESVNRKRKCHICPKEFHFRDGESYRSHIRRHLGDTPWVCEICGKGFITKDRFKMHSRTVHSTAQPFQCEFCVMKYKSMKSLRRHQRSVHKEQAGLEVDEGWKRQFMNVERRPDFIGPKIAYPCDYCDKVFELRSRMTKHVKTAHGNLEELNGMIPTSDPLADL